MSAMIESQLDCSDCILVNKIDHVDDDTADTVVEDIRTITGMPSYIKQQGPSLYTKAYGQR